MTEHFAYIIADTLPSAREIFQHWTLAGPEERRAYESWNIVFKGEADARHLLGRHLKEAKPGQSPKIWQIVVALTELDVAHSQTGVPPYREGDILTVYSRRHGERFRAEVQEVLLTGRMRPWTVHIKSLGYSGDSQHFTGTLEADDDGTSPNIVVESPS